MRIRIAKPDNYDNLSETGPWHLDVDVMTDSGITYLASVRVQDPRQPDSNQNMTVIGRCQRLPPEEPIKEAGRQYLKAWGEGSLPDRDFSTTTD